MDEHTDGEKVEKKTFATAIPDNAAIPVGVAMGITFGIVFWAAFDDSAEKRYVKQGII